LSADRARFAAAHARWLVAARPSLRRFRRALREPLAAQERALERILARTAGSEYGRRHGLAAVRSLREYQERVPIVVPDLLAPDIASMLGGRPGVLTTEPVVAFERTTGTTGGARHVPYTQGLLEELSSALLPWMADTWLRDPALLLGGAYWSVSPMAATRETTACGVPIGFEEDVQYFGALGPALQRVLLAPPGLARIDDVETCRYVTLRFLVQDTHLRFASVWHPSFLDLLADALHAHGEWLVADVRDGTLRPPTPLPPDLAAAFGRHLRARPRRAHRLASLAARDGGLRPEAVWPHLRVVSCWADGAAAPHAAALARRFPQARVQPKGLLATEGVVSIPWGAGPGAVLAVSSHVLEFVDDEAPEARPRLAHELEQGRTYSVLLTTSGGLHRYALGDRVRVVGRTAATPRIEFLGRERLVSDLCGEKLHEAAVGAALRAALAETGAVPAFTLLAPEAGAPPSYALFVECAELPAAALRRVAGRLDRELSGNPHYAYCRRLGQLGAVRPFAVRRHGTRAYLERLAGEGQRSGTVKPAALSARSGWSERFEGAFVDAP
jgi:hypothetical protein